MLNLIVLVGRLTADPELRKTPSNISFTRFSIAVTRNYIPKNGGDREVDFFSVIAWRAVAEYICKYIKKGNLIVIQGSIRTGTYEKDNIKRNTFDVIASNVGSYLNPLMKSPQKVENTVDDEDEQFIF